MTFKVNNHVWKIQYEKSNSPNLLRSDGTLTLAVCDNNVKTIYMNNKLKGYMFDKVLCHELTHVYAMEFDYFMDIETEETVADFMSLFGRDIIYLLDDLVKILRRAV